MGEKKGKRKGYILKIEGTGLRDVMATPGVNAAETLSNHVVEIEQVLGIEAARTKIMQEMGKTMSAYGINVDIRHIQLLGECMTFKGRVLGVNRNGITHMRNSVLWLASFEQTNERLFEAAGRQKNDSVKGCSESIILGSNINMGTGLFKLLYDSGGRSGAAASTSSRTPALRSWKTGTQKIG